MITDVTRVSKDNDAAHTLDKRMSWGLVVSLTLWRVPARLVTVTTGWIMLQERPLPVLEVRPVL